MQRTCENCSLLATGGCVHCENIEGTEVQSSCGRAHRQHSPSGHGGCTMRAKNAVTTAKAAGAGLDLLTWPPRRQTSARGRISYWADINWLVGDDLLAGGERVGTHD